MEDYSRYAIYYAPEAGPLRDFGARWLGRDTESGREFAPPALPGLPRPAEEITRAPRKYGFHGTIKPPFRLAPGTEAGSLHRAAGAMARRLAPVTLDGLQLSRLGDFLALTPRGDATLLAHLARQVVTGLDRFRAPPDAEERARRRPENLSAAQRALLDRWGYPYVMEEFRFHLTLTGPMDAAELAATEAALGPVVAPLLPEPFQITSLCLFGEAPDGRFHLLHRYTLSG